MSKAKVTFSLFEKLSPHLKKTKEPKNNYHNFKRLLVSVPKPKKKHTVVCCKRCLLKKNNTWAKTKTVARFLFFAKKTEYKR
jgi:hypothetical protein